MGGYITDKAFFSGSVVFLFSASLFYTKFLERFFFFLYSWNGVVCLWSEHRSARERVDLRAWVKFFG